MTTHNLALYRVLQKMGATDAEAEAAATFDASELATKQDVALVRADLKAELADLRSDLLKWGVALLFTGLTLQTALVIFALSRLVRP